MDKRTAGLVGAISALTLSLRQPRHRENARRSLNAAVVCRASPTYTECFHSFEGSDGGRL